MTTLGYFVDDKDVTVALFRLQALLSPVGMSAFLGTTIGPYLAKRAKERFQSEGDDVTGAWTPLKPATIAIRESEGYGAGPINRRTGELENWVVRGGWNAYPTGFGASMEFPKKKPSGELKAKVETAQKGRQFPNTVARPVLGVNEQDLIFFQAALMSGIEQAIK